MARNLNDFYQFLEYVTRRRRAWFFVKNCLLFLFLCGVTFGILNFPALSMQLQYRVAPSTIALPKRIHGSDFPIETHSQPRYPNNTLIVEKIGVQAPILWDSTTENIEENLTQGVVHLAGSAYPGQKGNVFITGHSSNFWWRKGDYNTVFALLNNLAVGDEIVVVYQDKEFHYQVHRKLKVAPGEIGQYTQSTDEPVLTLMTCWPIGTNWKRLIVQAKLVF